MTKINSYRYFKTSPEIINLVVMYYVRYPLSLRQIEDILFEPGIDVCHETIRYWWNRFGPQMAKKIRSKRYGQQSNWRWHMDEVFVKINGETHYLWHAVDHEGEVLEAYVTKQRDRRAALAFLKRVLRNYGSPHEIVTDRLRSYEAALRVLGLKKIQDVGRHKNNRCENSHLPFRRRERAMQKFRSWTTLQKFTSIHGQFYNHFNHERHLQNRGHYKKLRAESLSQWQVSFARYF